MTQLAKIKDTPPTIHLAIFDYIVMCKKKKSVIPTACASQTNKLPVEQKVGTGALVC